MSPRARRATPTPRDGEGLVRPQPRHGPRRGGRGDGATVGRYTVANGGEPQLWWADRQYDFRAYLDSAGKVLDLVGDYDRLDAADRSVLTCPELRYGQRAALARARGPSRMRR